MKVIFSGTRDIHVSRQELADAIAESGFEITEVVSGGGGNVDRSALEFARVCGYPSTVFYPGWGKHGKAAGPMRNREMAKYADALIHFWDGKSKGTKNMIEEAEEVGLKIYGAKAVSTATRNRDRFVTDGESWQR